MHKLHLHLHNFFIPHEGNNHWPHAVRHKMLLTYSGLMVTAKVLIVSLLFATFPTIAQFSTITQARVTQLVNQARQAQGLGRVSINPTLQKAAELKLQDMINKGYFAHTSPEGILPWTWFKEAGYLYTYAGENLAMNFTEAEDAHQAWMDSSTHRANILNNNYQEIGVAVGVGQADGQPATLVVQLFGTSFVPPMVVAEEPASQPQVQGTTLAQATEPATEPASQAQTANTNESTVEQPVEIIEQSAPLKESVGEPEQLAQAPTKPAGSQPQTAIQREPVEAPLPSQPIVITRDITGGSQAVEISALPRSDVVGKILKLIQDFRWVLLGFVAIALLLKIIIRAHIQHKQVIIHGTLVLAIGLLLIVLHLHFLEAISGPVIVF